MSWRPRMQTCACGDGCEDRSAVKWRGQLIVECVPDEQAQRVVDALTEAEEGAARMERRDAARMLRSEAAILRVNAALGNSDDCVRAIHYMGAALLVEMMGGRFEEGS